MKLLLMDEIASSIFRWLGSWGAAGLFMFGIVNGFIPIPGGIDLMTALFAAGHRELWFFYASLSTAGSVIGGYVAYHLARKGGKAALEQRVSKAKLDRIDAMFCKWGFGTVVLSAIMPPPFPALPLVAGAGALNYPVKKFVAALLMGRFARFTLLAYLSSLYGRKVIRWISGMHVSFQWVWIAIAVLAGAGAGAGIWLWIRHSRKAI
jgi:membrane protein DedA with SNARE-associated domain